MNFAAKPRAADLGRRNWPRTKYGPGKGGGGAVANRDLAVLAWGFGLSVVLLFHARAFEIWTGLPSVSLVGYGMMALVALLAILLSPVRVLLCVEDRVLMFFALLVLLRAALASEPVAALTDAGILVGAGLSQYFLARIVLQSLGRVDFIVWSSMAMVTAITVFLAFSLADSEMDRVTMGADHNPVGVSMVMVSSGAAALVATYWVFVSPRWRRNAKRFLHAAAALLVFFLCARLALATGTRSTLVAFVAVALGLLLLRFVAADVVTILAGILLSLGALMLGWTYGAALSIWLAENVGISLGERWESAFLRLAQAFDPNAVSTFVLDMSVDERMVLQAIHWNGFREYIWFGAGPRLVDAAGPFIYPHNLFVELLSYYGVFGLLLFAAFLLTVSVRVIDLARWEALGFSGYVAVALCLGALAQLQFSFTLWVAKPLFFGTAVLVTLHRQASVGRARRPVGFRARPDFTRVTPAGLPKTPQRLPSTRLDDA